jgi:tetraacyldisaccharide 4'-kinase
VIRALLWPASLAWDAGARLKAATYRCGVRRVRRLPGNVISVGNLTTGGTGKTPMVIWLAERFLAEGKRVAILTRGYRAIRDSAGELQSDEIAIFRERFGDRVPIGAGANRYAHREALAKAGVSWFLLDDGFQHLQLARDANIVLLDATDPFGGGHLLPVGSLREPKSALARADIVVITRSDHAPAIEAITRRYTRAPVFYARTELLDVFSLSDVKAERPVLTPRSEWPGLRFVPFCAIGNSQAFFEDLTQAGMNTIGATSFPDHHKYAQKEIDVLVAQAREAGASLICTEKDLFNLRDISIQSVPLYLARTTLRISDEQGYLRAIQEIVARQHGGSAR